MDDDDEEQDEDEDDFGDECVLRSCQEHRRDADLAIFLGIRTTTTCPGKSVARRRSCLLP